MVVKDIHIPVWHNEIDTKLSHASLRIFFSRCISECQMYILWNKIRQKFVFTTLFSKLQFDSNQPIVNRSLWLAYQSVALQMRDSNIEIHLKYFVKENVLWNHWNLENKSRCINLCNSSIKTEFINFINIKSQKPSDYLQMTSLPWVGLGGRWIMVPGDIGS